MKVFWPRVPTEKDLARLRTHFRHQLGPEEEVVPVRYAETTEAEFIRLIRDNSGTFVFTTRPEFRAKAVIDKVPYGWVDRDSDLGTSVPQSQISQYQSVQA